MTATPTADELRQRAAKLQPALAERASEADELRRIPDANMHAMVEAGFFRILQPARYGGYEHPPQVFFDVQAAVAAACPSTAWVLGVVGVHAWQLALFDERAQDDVWAGDSSALVSSSYAPTGKVTRAEGGYRISGRWSFSSGCDHCQWVFLGGMVPPEAEGKPPDMRTFLLPRADYTIEDNWHVIGLRGTGSKDIVVDDVFVPEHRTHRLMDGFKCDSPGNQVNDTPLYRLPFGQVFVRSVSTSAIGIAQGALNAYRKVTATRIAASTGSKVAIDPAAQTVCARAQAMVDDARAVLHRNFADMLAFAEAGEPIPLENRLRYRLDSSLVVERAVEVVDALFTESGGRAIFLSSPIHRYFLDIHAARAHFANNPEKPARNFGGVLLQQKNQDFFL